MLELDLIRRLVDDAGPGVWVVTERSSPGWRVECEDGSLVCIGPEQLFEAARGRLIAQAKILLPALVQEVDDARDLIIQLTGEAEEHRSRIASLEQVRDRVQELLGGTENADLAWALESECYLT